MKVADLFAGVGGLSHGFIKAGFDVDIAIEYDKDIAASYKKNHPQTDVYAEDITKLNLEDIHAKHPKIDIVMGGPPCQGYSQKGKRLSLNDPRNYLFKQFVRFVEVFSPKYFVLENVPNIITTSNGYFKEEIITAFNALGYDVCCGILNAYDFGVPQRRQRALFLGQKGKLEIDLPQPTGQHRSVQEAIYDLPFIQSGEGNEKSKYDKPCYTQFQRELRGKCETLYNHVATKHSPAAIRKLEMIPKGKGKEILPSEMLTKSIYSGTWCRLIEDEPAATITTRFDTPSSGRFTHPVLNRCITTREAARLQTFPDDFVFHGNKTCQMKQVGNAVPPLLAFHIAQVIKNNENKNKML